MKITGVHESLLKNNQNIMGVKQVLKNLDAFPRAEEHLLQKTQSGAVGKFFLLLIKVPLIFIRTFLSECGFTWMVTMLDWRKNEQILTIMR